ncbi:MAG: ABC transporter permease [Verrucomicrobia bacterium]|nr:ABC transporter permease [Verrucomicrobiota bacterium]MDA1006154.1 ABC transporter permease [Verrucomicrobiota bacterium]
MSASLPTNLEKGTSLWKDAWHRLFQNKLAVLGLFTVLFIFAACFIGGPIMHWMDIDPNKQSLADKFAGPSGEHLLGTDQLGRDFLVRILDGGQISLLIALLATLATVTIGIIYGGIAGYVGGRLGNTMMRIVDGLLAMPFLIVVILFREITKPRIELIGQFLIDQWEWNRDLVLRFSNILPLLVAIAAFGWLTMARIVRTQTASLAQQEFVEAARSLGISHTRILFRHIVPNMLGPIIIYATLTIPSFILYEATLSFLGLGIEPPNSSWGTLIKEGANYLETKTAMILFPSILFSLTLFAFNFLGDGLRDALDPKAAKD